MISSTRNSNYQKVNLLHDNYANEERKAMMNKMNELSISEIDLFLFI